MTSSMESSRRVEKDSPLEKHEDSQEPVTESNDEQSDESRQQLIDHIDLDAIAPDGGWGWVVCFASFLINVIVDGTFFSFGIILIDLLDFFKESRAKTAWIGSTLLGMSMVMGPVVSFLLKYLSCRQMVISGTLLTVCSFIASVFAPNVEILILTYGFFGGIGMGMVFIPAIIIVGLYFNKKRAIATGIATSGAGVGVFVYGYLCDYLLDEFEWRGTLLILAGLLLNCVVCGAVFRPIVEQKLRRRLRLLKSRPQSSLSSDYSGSGQKHELPDQSNEAIHIDAEKHFFHLPHKMDERNPRIFSKHFRLYKSAQHLSHMRDEDVVVTPPLLSTSCHHIEHRDTCDLSDDSNSDILRIQHGLLRPMLRKDIYYSGSVQQLPDYKQCGSMTSFLARMTQESSVEDSDSSYSSRLSSFWTRLVHKTSLSLFKDPVLLLLLVVFSMWTVQSVTLTYFPDMAVSKGIHRSQAAILISVVGITNTLGRIIAGFCHDGLHIKGISLYIGALFMAATVNFAIPHCYTFAWLASCAGLFGLCMGVAVSMRTIVLTEQLGIEQLTSSFGLVALFQGITFMVDPPIAGELYAIENSYTLPYVMAGSMYLLSCVCSVIISCIRRHQKTTSKDIIISVEDIETIER